MKNRYLLIASIIVLILTTVIFVIFKPKQQFGAFTRIIKSVKLSTPKIFANHDYINNVIIYKNVYYLNRLTNVLRLDSNGKIIDTLYCRIDNSNDQFFIGFDVDSSGIYLQDARAKALSVLDFKGETIRQVRINDRLERCVHLKNDVYLYKTVLKTDNFQNEKLKIMDFRNNIGHLFTNILPISNDNGIGTDGFFIKSPNGSIFHIYYYMSGIVAFDSGGNYIKTFYSKDGSMNLPLTVKTPIGHVPSPHSPAVHFAGTADSKYIYIASNFLSRSETEDISSTKIVIDVYDQLKGAYIYSFYIPKNGNGDVSSLAVHNNQLSVIQESKTLTIYYLLK